MPENSDKGDIMVSLRKSYRTRAYTVYVTDGDNLDYYSAELDNRAMFMLIGRAYAIGYKEFEIGLSMLNPGTNPKDTILVKVGKDGALWVNWDLVAKAPLEAWGARRLPL